ncbi:unnamed protein product [Ilex paraguariensis]|uniref:SUZ domain-containing protein n=1 Tax=Ilex paraguariensis TaxID=185542 RepID=A0ABC8UI80_9AQUA
MEERKEEYDRARARIFSSLSSSSLDSVHTMSRAPLEGKNMCFSGDDSEALGENLSSRDSGTLSRVTIFRDSQKDRIDLDYDQSCETGPRGNRTLFLDQKLLCPTLHDLLMD